MSIFYRYVCHHVEMYIMFKLLDPFLYNLVEFVKSLLNVKPINFYVQVPEVVI